MRSSTGSPATDQDQPLEPLLQSHGLSLSDQLRSLRRRLREYLAEQAASKRRVPMLRGEHRRLWGVRDAGWTAHTSLRFRVRR